MLLTRSECFRLRGQEVKTSPFHGGNTGSIPVGVIATGLFQLLFFLEKQAAFAAKEVLHRKYLCKTVDSFAASTLEKVN